MAKSIQTKGIISVICNKCGTKMDIPTARFYSKTVPAWHEHRLVKEAVRSGDGKTIVKPAEYVNVYHPTIRTQHKDFGGACEGTFRTAPTAKLKQWKASRDRKPRGGQK